ncbi:MAG TPA: hypothetical protein VFL36_17085 [Myxococcales bacterium]|nr:hypothetical protein [Myxococcales bacterium]
MSTQLLGLVISVIGAILFVGVAVGLPAIAVTAIKFFKYKERELAMEMEYRQRSGQHQDNQVALEQRVQVLEDALTRLDQDVREHLGIGQPATALPSRPELFESSAAPDDVAAKAPVRNKLR